MQLDYVHTHRVLKENHAMKYVEPMVCVMYLTIHNADNDMRSGNKVEKAIKCKCGHSYRGGA